MKLCPFLALGVAAILAGPMPVLAASCEIWTAGQSLEEEGTTMLASVCAMAHHDDVLNISCGGEGRLRLTYLPSVGDDFPPGGNMNYKAIFEFRAGDKVAMETLRYQAMDGALVARPFRDSDIIALLKGMTPVKVTDITGRLNPRTFGVKASLAAIGKVEKGCYN
jgi:hypothetical protein